MKIKRILVTGGAGFIGFSLCQKLLKEKKYKVFSVDNLNNYYSVKIKKDRINLLQKNYKNFYFSKIDIANFKKLNNYVKINKIEKIVHLAAQAGVRYSYTKPEVYFRSNMLGFFNVLETSRLNNVSEVIAASSSSVYGEQSKFPIKESYENSKPIQFYAATKKSNIDDIVSGIHKLISKKNKGYRIFNIGNNKKVKLMDMIKFLEKFLNKKAKINFLPMQPGDIYKTHSSTKSLKNYVNYKSKTEIKAGIKNFVNWFLDYYK